MRVTQPLTIRTGHGKWKMGMGVWGSRFFIDNLAEGVLWRLRLLWPTKKESNCRGTRRLDVRIWSCRPPKSHPPDQPLHVGYFRPRAGQWGPDWNELSGSWDPNLWRCRNCGPALYYRVNFKREFPRKYFSR